jgi:hypothetical protein
MADPALNPAIDVNSIISNFASAQKQITASKQDLENSQKIGVDAQATLESAISESAAVQAKENDVAAQAAIKKQKDIAEATAAIGTNPDAASYVVTTLGEAIRVGNEDLGRRDAMIQQKLDTGFMDDPVGWVVNQFTLPADVAAYNNKANAVNQKTAQLSEVLKLTSEAGTALAVVDTADAATMAALQNEKLLADAKATAAKSRSEFAKFGLSVITTRNATTKEQFDAVISMNNAIVNVARLGIEKDNAERAERRFTQIELPSLKISQDQLQLSREQVLIAFERLGLDRDAADRDLERLGISKSQLRLSQEQEALIKRRFNEIELPSMELRKEEAVRQQKQLEISEKQLNLALDSFQFQKDTTLETLGMAKDRNERERRMTDLQAGEILQRLADAREHLNLAQKSYLLQKELADITIEAKKENQESIKLMDAKLYRTATALGLEPVTYLQFKNMGQAQRAKWESLMSDPAIDQGRMGATPVDAMNNIQGVTNKLPLEMDKIRAQLLNTKAELAKDPQWHGLKPDEQNMKWQQAIDTLVKRETSAVRDQGSIFSPPPISVLLKAPVIANSVIGKDLAEIAKADPYQPLRSQQVISLAQAKIASGQMRPDQAAAEISQLYQGVLDTNNERYKYLRWSIIPPTGFNATVSGGAGYGSEVNLNLADKAKVENFLLRSRTPRNNFGISP